MDTDRQDNHDILTVQEAAREMRVSEKTIYRMIASGAIPVISATDKPHSRKRIPRAAIHRVSERAMQPEGSQ